MPTVHPIDEDNLTEPDKTATDIHRTALPGSSTRFVQGTLTMNSKLLFAATVAISVLSSVAMADEGATPLSRAQVNAELARAVATHTLQRSDYDASDYGVSSAANVSNVTRAQTLADLADAKSARKVLVGPDANRTYNPFGTEIYKRSLLTRAEVKADVLQAAANGTLQRSDYDDQALVARRAQQHAAPSKFAQRVKAVFARDAG
jgi:hypothetical protein